MLTYCTRILKFLPASFITVILKREVFMDKDTFKQEAKTLLSEAEAVIDLDDSHQLDQTAATLEGYHYAPTLLWPINGFVRMNKEKLLRVMKEAFESDDDALISYGFDTSADLDESGCSRCAPSCTIIAFFFAFVREKQRLGISSANCTRTIK